MSKLKQFTGASLLMFSLMGCAHPSLESTPPPIPAKAITEAPAVSYHFSDENDSAVEQAFKRYLKTGKAPAIKTDGFEMLAFNSGQQPILKTTPFEESVISLEAGEKFTNISSGDPSRWSYAVAVSGSGAQQQQHILVKPSLPDISTNLVISTDRRLYTLRLVSTRTSEPTRQVRFWYPEDRLAAVTGNTTLIAKTNETLTSSTADFPAGALHFHYRLSSPWFRRSPAWKPERVFDDGSRTYIQFPGSIAKGDMPVLFVLDEGGQPTLVNYRSQSPYYIVDTLFKRAILVAGVGRQQSKVALTRT